MSSRVPSQCGASSSNAAVSQGKNSISWFGHGQPTQGIHLDDCLPWGAQTRSSTGSARFAARSYLCTPPQQAAGDRFPRLELNAVVQEVVLSGSPRPAAEEFARDSPLRVDDVLSSPYVLIGSLDAIAEAVLEKRERHGFSYWVVFEDSMDAFAPVVSRLAGS